MTTPKLSPALRQMLNDYCRTHEAVILANGDYPSHPLPLHLLNEASHVVCCDGSGDAYIAHGGTPHAIIGDGDSLSETNRARYAGIIHRIAEQETNDQTKAVRFLREESKKNLLIAGATGKREDHTLGNISLLIEYMREGIQAVMATDYGIFVPCRGTRSFPCFPGQKVSIFNFGSSLLRSEGLVYPTSGFTNWWQGTLNEASANRFTIHADGEYLIFLNYPENEAAEP